MLFSGCNWFVRHFEFGDIAAFMAYRNNLEWMQYQHFKGLSFFEYQQHLLSKSSINKGIQLAIIQPSTNQLMGDLFVIRRSRRITIGYTIAPAYANQGYMSAILPRFVDYLLSNYPKHQIQAYTYSANHASIRVLQKTGFIYQEYEKKEQRERYLFVPQMRLKADN